MRALLFCAIAALHPGCLGGDDDDEPTPPVAPACASPAPLVPDGAGSVEADYVVETSDPSAIDGIAARHYIAIEQRLPTEKGFVARMRPATLAAIRCEPAVTRVTVNEPQ